jgi:predicted RecB family nuclease
VLKLSGKGVRKALELMAEGIHRIQDVPADVKLSKVNKRQKLALEQGDLAVEAGLKKAMASLESPVGYLDFETVARAIPVWDGLKPWGAVPVQFSYHEEQANGTHTHAEWLADGPEDPRPAIARALVEATKNAGHIVVYTSFESQQLRHLAAAVPELASELEDINSRLFDLHKVVKNNVYHPDFDGSFSIKDVLPVLVPELGYEDLEIDDGQDASAEIARMMLDGDSMSDEERAELRENLLKYCKRDTEAMVGLVGRLRELAAPGSDGS